jgi:hypothetical protein
MTYTFHMEDQSLILARFNPFIMDILRQKSTLTMNTPEGKNVCELLTNVMALYYAEKQRLNIDVNGAGAACSSSVVSGCEPNRDTDTKKEDDEKVDELDDDDDDISSTGESEYNFSDVDSEEEDRVTEQFIDCGYRLGTERNNKGFVVNKKACYNLTLADDN